MSTISQNNILTACKSLKVEDKISTVFLLSNNDKSALHVIRELSKCDTDNNDSNGLFQQFLLQSFAQNPQSVNAFVEAMCIIQNFRINRLLGLSKIEMTSAPFIDCVNAVKKHLFLVSDSLTEKETVELINRVNGSSSETLETLEEALLYWQVHGRLNLGTDLDSSSLEFVMKHMTKNEEPAIKYQSSNVDEECYAIIDKSNLGFCIVINNSEFSRNKEFPQLMPDHELANRPGSEKDILAIKDIFNWLNFQVIVHQNVPYETLRNLLVKYANSVETKHSCIVLVFMSHGTEDVVYTADSVPISVEALEMAFQRNKCPLLTGKPKILIIQACQGSLLQVVMKDSPTPATLDHLSLGPERGDALVAWSTVKGYASLRDRFEGSWFIQELCAELKASAASRDLVDIVTRVNDSLRKKNYHGVTMVPSLSMSLCKKIRLL